AASGANALGDERAVHADAMARRTGGGGGVHFHGVGLHQTPRDAVGNRGSVRVRGAGLHRRTGGPGGGEGYGVAVLMDERPRRVKWRMLLTNLWNPAPNAGAGTCSCGRISHRSWACRWWRWPASRF